MTGSGHERLIDTATAVAACPFRSESGQRDKRFGKSALCQKRDSCTGAKALPIFEQLGASSRRR
jgi:hypothetical protein